MKKLPKIISQEEFEKIFKAEDDKQIKLAMLLGFEAGMRISEIVGLRPIISRCCKVQVLIEREYNELKRKDLQVIKCGSCLKILDLSHDTQRLKEGWQIQPLTRENVDVASIRIISGKGQKDRIVPKPKRLNENALKLLPIKLSRRTLQRAVKKLGKEVLNKDITFHTLRHGFGSHLATNNRPLHEIQMLMGHSRLDTTGIYLHANPVKAIQGASDVF